MSFDYLAVIRYPTRMVNKAKRSVTLDSDLVKQVKEYAKKERRNFSDALNYIVARFFRNK